ncbi:hypothetical protein RFI_37275 [Reticulomyxa filosa]|uniref:Uncharacterized protein n=1 Tax=Reticulomyxa filosa TaxID=46433 RepID=X6LDU2_RETFI|nr:hypothetical protein RFI_37275 [Reticulomyxa filosa]|eukprot:ETO00178.1 hypothetical protein RFI_37275 [Reticulomyxa filosa]
MIAAHSSFLKILGGTSTYCGSSVIESSNGGLLITGGCYGSVLLAKFESNDTLAWVKTLDGSGSCAISSLIETDDGGLVITGIFSKYQINYQALCNYLFSKYDPLDADFEYQIVFYN